MYRERCVYVRIYIYIYIYIPVLKAKGVKEESTGRQGGRNKAGTCMCVRIYIYILHVHR